MVKDSDNYIRKIQSMSKPSKLSFLNIIGIFKSHFPNDINLNLYENMPSFQVQRKSRIIKQSDPATEKYEDINKFSGLISAPNMYFRTAYHESTKTVHLLGARSSEFLSGAINDHNYIKYSIKTDGTSEEIEKAKTICRIKINTFNDNYMNMMRSFFTVDVKTTDDGSTLFITPYYAHLIKENKQGKYDIILKDRAFEPKNLAKKSKLTRIFTDVSMTMQTCNTYEEAYDKVMRSWQSIMSNTWDGNAPYDIPNMKLKGYLAGVFNMGRHHGGEALIVHSAIGLGMGALTSKYTIGGGLIAAVIHTAAHLVLGSGYNRLSKLAEQKLNRANSLDNFQKWTDVSDFFKVHNTSNFLRVGQKIDFERFPIDEWKYLEFSESLLENHEEPSVSFRPGALAPYIYSLNDKFGSYRYELDKYTELRIFQNGIISIKLQNPSSGIESFYTKYREDACNNDDIRLSPKRIKEMNSGITTFKYNRRGADYYSGFSEVSYISDNEFYKIIEKHIAPKNNPYIDLIKESFTPTGSSSHKKNLFMNGKPPVLRLNY